MSWADYQLSQDPDLPVRSDDVLSERDTVVNSGPAEMPADLEALADKLMLPLAWLEEVDWLFRDRGAVIFTGPPGSGKTFVARALAEFYAPQRNRFLQFHPSYAYEDFVEGYRPVIAPGDKLLYQVMPGPLRAAISDAAGASVIHAMVIDEINRANLSKVLGELFFALEYRDVPVRPQYSDEELQIPANLWFIGTMNTADRSIANFDAALRRRFHFVTCDPSSPPFDGLLRRFLAREGLGSMDWIANLLQRANERVPDSDFAIGPSHFMRPGLTTEDAQRIWTHSVWPFLTSRFDAESIPDLRWKSLYAATSGEILGDVDPLPSAEIDEGEHDGATPVT